MDALALELRATAPAAPEHLRARVDQIAAQTPPVAASWRVWFQPRRALLVAAPVAAAAMLAVAIGHGLTTTSTDSATTLSPRTKAAREAPSALNAGSDVFSAADRGVVGGPAPLPFQQRALNLGDSTSRSANGVSGSYGGAKSAAKAAPQTARDRAQDYRATLTVRLPNVDRMSDAMKHAINASRAWGGYVVAAEYNVPGSDGDAQLVVRIPVQHVQAAIQRFSGLGTLAAQDVQIRDVQGKLDSYTRQWLTTREHIAKLKVKLAQAETDAQRASLEFQIAQAQKTAAEVRAAQVALKRQASFAKVTLTLTTREAAAAVAPHKDNRVGSTLKDAASILALELAFLLYGLIVAAPIALVGAIVFFAVRAGRRRADDRLLGST
jgi:hypothetical protein